MNSEFFVNEVAQKLEEKAHELTEQQDVTFM